MAFPLIAAGVMAGMSVLSGIAANKDTNRQLQSNVEQIKKDYEKQIGQIQEQFNSANENIALEMTTNRYNGLKLTGSTTNSLVNREIAGNTALKQYNQSVMASMFAHNALQKKAEDTWKSFGVEMDNTKQQANNAIYSVANQARSNMKSGLQIATSAAQAGMAGYAMGNALSGALPTTTATTTASSAALDSGTSLISESGYGSSTVGLFEGSYNLTDTPITNSYFGGIS